MTDSRDRFKAHVAKYSLSSSRAALSQHRGGLCQVHRETIHLHFPGRAMLSWEALCSRDNLRGHFNLCSNIEIVTVCSKLVFAEEDLLCP